MQNILFKCIDLLTYALKKREEILRDPMKNTLNYILQVFCTYQMAAPKQNSLQNFYVNA